MKDTVDKYAELEKLLTEKIDLVLKLKDCLLSKDKSLLANAETIKSQYNSVDLKIKELKNKIK